MLFFPMLLESSDFHSKVEDNYACEGHVSYEGVEAEVRVRAEVQQKNREQYYRGREDRDHSHALASYPFGIFRMGMPVVKI